MKKIKSLTDLILNLTSLRFRQKYFNSYLGFAWNFIYPLMLFSIYALVFGFVFKNRLHAHSSSWEYLLYFSCSFFPWIFFEDTLKTATDSLLENFNIIKKVSTPIEIFPVSYSLSNFLTLLINFSVIFIFGSYIKGLKVENLIFTLGSLTLLLLFTMGLSLFLSSLNIILRDLKPILNLILFVTFWATPIVYDESFVPLHLKWIIQWNPMYYFLKGIQDPIFHGVIPTSLVWLTLLSLTITSLLSGIITIRLLKFKIYDLL